MILCLLYYKKDKDMNKIININNKIINIYYNGSKNESLPVVIYNTFEGNGEQLWFETQKLSCENYALVVIENIDWNNELTPWPTGPIYKNDAPCLGQADQYIGLLENQIIPILKTEINCKYFCIAGYSLAGLFAIYSLYKSTIFSKVISGSGSLWYPEFNEYVHSNNILNKPSKIYISLGDTEKNSRNKILSTVEISTLSIYNFYKEQGIDIKFEYNRGGHFNDANKRMAKGIKYILE